MNVTEAAPDPASGARGLPGEMPASMPGQLMHLGFELMCMGAEAQAVIAMRMMGMGGLWRVAPEEGGRMMVEKTLNFADAASAAVSAASAGMRPDQVMTAAVETLRAKTVANARRLGRAGIRMPLDFTPSRAGEG